MNGVGVKLAVSLIFPTSSHYTSFSRASELPSTASSPIARRLSGLSIPCSLRKSSCQSEAWQSPAEGASRATQGSAVIKSVNVRNVYPYCKVTYLAQAVSRSYRKWLQGIELVVLELRIAQPALRVELVWLSEEFLVPVCRQMVDSQGRAARDPFTAYCSTASGHHARKLRRHWRVHAQALLEDCH
jgi:hypothetical protein